MASITKLELQQALTVRNTELEAARLRIAELEGDVASLKAMYGRAAQAVVASDCARGEALMELRNKQVIKPAYVRVAREATPEQIAYRAACAQARDFAMRTGKSVKVSVR